MPTKPLTERFMEALKDAIDALPTARRFGRVVGLHGLLVEIAGIADSLHLGARLVIEGERPLPVEVVGVRGETALCLAYKALHGVRIGARAFLLPQGGLVYPSGAWLGRVVNAFGEPMDGKGPIPPGPQSYALRAPPPDAHSRSRMGGKQSVGVRALNAFVPCCRGQRLGIFAGSGVGKSVLLSMLARYTACDVAVIGLVGERGREVHDFLDDDLGAEGLARSVVIVATSDEGALMRRQAAYLTLTAAEYFRDQGAQVLCLMDSVTRFATAQREIGLAVGEPPTTRGFTPTVFAELPKLLERAGPGTGEGAITGIFTVLVDGDDHNEPIADAVRGILDGHIVMERSIAERGRYPAINVLKSISRALPRCHSEEENELIREARRLLATYEDMAELIRLGAYKKGTDPDVDRAIRAYPQLEAFLSQYKDESADLDQTFAGLKQILGGLDGGAPS